MIDCSILHRFCPKPHGIFLSKNTKKKRTAIVDLEKFELVKRGLNRTVKEICELKEAWYRINSQNNNKKRTANCRMCLDIHIQNYTAVVHGFAGWHRPGVSESSPVLTHERRWTPRNRCSPNY